MHFKPKMIPHLSHHRGSPHQPMISLEMTETEIIQHSKKVDDSYHLIVIIEKKQLPKIQPNLNPCKSQLTAV